MDDPILTLARNVFNQKYSELEKVRDELRAGQNNHASIGTKKIAGYRKLVEELGHNFKRAEKLLKEIERLFSAQQKSGK